MIDHNSDSLSPTPGAVPVACAAIGADLLAWFRDELSPAERARVDEHLSSGCTECHAALAGMRALEDLLSSFAPVSPEPSPELFARLAASLHAPAGDSGARESHPARRKPGSRVDADSPRRPAM